MIENKLNKYHVSGFATTDPTTRDANEAWPQTDVAASKNGEVKTTDNRAGQEENT